MSEITNEELQKVTQEKINGVYPHIAITNHEGAIMWVSTGYLVAELLALRKQNAEMQKKLDELENDIPLEQACKKIDDLTEQLEAQETIASREGKETNWEVFKKSVYEELVIEHKIMYRKCVNK